MTAVTISVSLRWGDMDAYGHINNVEVLRVLEEARVRGLWNGSIPLPPLRADEPTWSMLSELHVRYLRPLAYGPDPVIVTLSVGRIGGAGFTIFYDVEHPAGGSAVVAESAVVLVDAATGAPTRLGAALRDALRSLEPCT